MNKKNPSQLRAYLTMTWYSLKAALRNRSTLFFSLVFPLIFISVFGLIGNNATNVKIGIADNIDQNNPLVVAIKQIPLINLQPSSQNELETKLKQGKMDAVINITNKENNTGYNVTLLTSSGNPTGAATARSIVSSIVDKVNLKLANVNNPPIFYEDKEVSGRQQRYIDFILPGQIGFSLLNTALFSTVFGFLALKKLLVLKRMFATPVKAITILLAQGTSRLVITLLQTVIILAIGILVFNFYLPHGIQTFAELIILSILGLISFLGFGLFFAGIAHDENSASPIVNLVVFPQLFLSGVFFPTDIMPSWIQPVANNLPLSYFNQAVRKVTLEGGSIVDTWPFILGFLAWGLVMYLLATRTFKWE